MVPKEFKENFEEELNIDKNPQNLRRPQKIGEDYYIETNLSAKETFKRIRTVLSTFNLEDELFICFKDEDSIVL